jgi:peptidoglycan hydrolase-like protein with peptidoglycan-binding domain
MIRKGMSGDAVKAWQIIVGVTPDGDFGSRTLDATVNFQTAHGLDGDGIVGQKTWTEGLNSLE